MKILRKMYLWRRKTVKFWKSRS